MSKPRDIHELLGTMEAAGLRYNTQIPNMRTVFVVQLRGFFWRTFRVSFAYGAALGSLVTLVVVRVAS